MAFGDTIQSQVLGNKPTVPVDTDATANAVAEGAAVNTTVGITAHSTFANGNADLDYSLVADSSGGGFKIDQSSGVVTVADPSKIDFESSPGHAYTITVRATKNGNFSSDQVFTISVNDVAPSTPVDSDSAANTVLEGAATGTATGITASASDINGGTVTWSLGGDTSGGGFTINATTGVITVADGSKIDYESAPAHAYTVTAVASDGTLTSSQAFTISVGDVAMTTPVDSNGAANTVAEGAANGTAVGITASAGDPNGPATTYALTNDAGGRFTINSSTGVVTVANGAAIDFETAPGHAYGITVQATSGAQTTSQSFSIGVTDVAPSTPADSNGAGNTVLEGAANNTPVGITATSTDPGGGPAPTFALTDSAGGRFAINATTGVVTVANGAAIDFETAPGAGHTYSITVQATAGALSNTQTFAIAVGNVNEAPAGTDKTVTIAEDNAYTFTVADFGFSDPSDSSAPNSLQAVKMTTVPGAGTGTFTNNGVTVNAGDSVSAANIAAGLLVFTPALNANGSPEASFTFQVQDNGGTANGGVDLDQSANILTINVTAVNDAPVNSVSATQSVNEDATLTFSSGNGNAITISDVDVGAGNETVTLTVTSGTLALGSTAGLASFTNNAASITLTGTVANVNAAMNGLTYHGNLNFNGTDTLVVSTNDNGNTGSGGAKTDTDNVTINVTSVNDAPAGADKTVTIAEDTPYTFGVADFGFSDPNDSSAPNSLQAVKMTTVPGAGTGTFTNNGVTVNAGDSVSAANIAAGLLVFTPALNANGSPEASFTFQVQDNGGTANGGVDLDQSANTLTINVTAVNDAPVNSVSATQTVNEDATLTFSSGNGNAITISDVDVGSGDETVTLTVTSGTLALGSTVGLTSFTNNAASISLTGTVANVNAAMNGLTYTGNLNFNGTDTLVVSTNDNGNTGSGGAKTDTDNVTINVTSVNDAPAGTDKTVTMLEGDSYTFSVADFGFSDPNDSSAPNSLLAVKMTTVPGAGTGTFTNNGATVNAGDFVSAANIAAGLLVFTPTAHATGAPEATFTFQVQDNGGTANGGVDLDQSPNNVAINVNAVNDAPINSVPAAAQAVNEEGVLTFSSGNGNAITISDIDVGSGDETVTLTVTGGTLALGSTVGLTSFTNNAASISLTGTVANVNAAMNGLTYTGNLNFNGTDTLVVNTNDNGNTGAGGPKTDSDNVTINVAAVNDAPVNGLSGTQTVNEDTALVFSTANSNAISISDVDAGAGNETVTLSVANGTLTLNGTAGLSFGLGDGIADSSMTFSGTVTAINAALNGLSYQGNLNFNGSDTLNITTNDNGNTGSGGAKSDTDAITINVTAVNDVPTFTVGVAQTVAEDSGAQTVNGFIPTFSPGPANETGQAVNFITSNDNNALFSAQPTIDPSGNLTYTSAANANGVAIVTVQIHDNGGTANGGVDTSASQTFTVTVGSINDAPSGTNNTLTTLEDTSYTFSAADFGFSDPVDGANSSGANNFQSVVITTVPGATGTLTNNNVTLSAGAIVTKADIDSGLLKFNPTANANGTPEASFTFQVKDDGGTGGGGVDTDPTPNTMAFNVTSVNDAPAGTNKTVGAAGSYTFQVTDFGFTDPADAGTAAGANALLKVKITTTPATGTLTNDGNLVNAGDFILATDIAAGKLLFTPSGGANDSFTFQVQDDGGILNGGVDLDQSANTFTINQDVAPTIIAGDTLNYTENATSFVDQTITITDPDNANMVSATVSITAGFDSTQDVLSFTPVGTITGSYNSATGVLSLSGNDTKANYELALESVTYNNTSDNPTTTQRTVSYVVNDGTLNSAPGTATININAVNDAPVVTPTGGSTAYIENASPVTVDGSITVVDPDSSITSAQVRISAGFQTGDTLNFADQNGITGVYTPGTGVLALSGTATVADYQTALRSITFSSTNNDPGASKTVEFKVHDQAVDSNLATKTLAITPVNDEPTLTATANGGGAVTFTETSTPDFAGSGPVDLFSSPATSTVEAGQTVTQVVLTVTNVADTTEYLNIGATAVDLVNGNSEGVTIGGAAGTATVSVTLGTATVTVTPTTPATAFTTAQVNTLVDNLTYNNDSNTPTATTHTISVTSLTDSGANGGANGDDNTGSPSVSTVVTVVPTNDKPIAVNDTFTGLNGAITNTTLVVDGPTAGTADPDGVQKTITGNILANDSDVDGGPLTVVAGTFATAEGGSVTLDTDGGFVYTPKPNTTGTPDTTDSFTYTVSDGHPVGQNGTATGTVTINFVPNSTIWYVDSSYDPLTHGASDGSSLRPFTDFTQLNGAGGAGDVDAAGDTIFVYDGTYTGNLELESGQKLYGERHGLTAPDGGGGAGTTTLLAANAGAGLTQINGTVTAATGGNNDIQAISWGSSAGVSLTGTNVGVLHVNDADPASAGSINNTTAGAVSINGSTAGTNMQFTSVSSGAGATGISLTGVNGTFNAAGGTLSGHSTSEIGISGGTGAITYAGTIGDGTGLSASIASRTGGSVTLSGNINDGSDVGGGISVSSNSGGTIDFTGTTKTLNTDTSNAVSMTGNSGATINLTGGGLDIHTTSGIGFSANSGTYSVTGSGNAINTTSGTALNLAVLTVGAGGITFGSATTTSAPTAISIDTVSGGAINVNGGSIAGATTRGVDINATSNDITIASSIATTTGRSVEVTGTTGNKTIAFSGAIDDNGQGINLATNTGTTINFTGALDIDSTTNTGFSATGGGTVNAGNTANSINTTTGTALNINGTDIGSNNLVFHDISSNGGLNNGINLVNTGTAAGNGGLHVLGSGSNVGATGGGVIANKTGGDGNSTQGIGIFLNNTKDVQLNGLQLNDFQNFAIRGNSVTGFTLDHSTINGDNGTSNSVSDGVAAFANVGEDAVRLTNLLGSGSITHSTISGGYTNTIMVENNTGTLNRLTIDQSTIGGRTNNGTGMNDGINFQADTGSTAMNITVSNSTLTTARAGVFVATTQVNATSDVKFQNNTVTNNHPQIVAGGGLGVDIAGLGNMTFDVSGNSFDMHAAQGGTGIKTHVIEINKGSGSGNSTFDGTVANNTVGVAGVLHSGSGVGSNDIDINSQSNGTFTIAILNNNLQQYDQTGIQISQISGNSTVNATIQGNTTVPGPGVNPFAGLWVVAGALASDAGTTNILVGGSGAQRNDLSAGDPTNSSDVFLQKGAGATLNLSKGVSAAATASQVIKDNNLNPANTTVGTSGTITLVSSNPPLPMLAAPGGVEASSPTPGETHLTQAELDTAVAAAIAQWASAGATATQLAALHSTVFSVADLSGITIAEQSLGHITIDTDAAGHGWFIDPTPNDNSEFAHAANATGTDLYTDPSNAAAGHLDLLTAVSHELGHVLGLGDTQASSDAHDLMFLTLVDGERRLPDASDVAQADDALVVKALETAVPLSAQAAAGTPVVAGTAGNDTIDAGHGGNILFGGGGADRFVFGPDIKLDAPAPAQITHVADYHAAQGDTFDFSALTSQFHNSSVNDAVVVRAVEDSSGKFATLQVNHIDPMSLPSAPNWVNVAQLDGAHAGDAVNVLIDNHSVHLAQIHVDLLV